MVPNLQTNLFSPKDCSFSITKLIFYFFKFSGIAVLSYDRVWLSERNSWRLLFKSSWIDKSYNLLSILFLIPLNIYVLSVVHKNEYIQSTDAEVSIFLVVISVLEINNVLTLLVFTFQSEKMVLIANKLLKLKELTAENYEENNNSGKTFFGTIFGSILGGVLLYLQNHKILLIYTLITQFNILITYFILIQYAFALKIVRTYYKFINDTLRDIFLKQTVWTLKNFEDHLRIDFLTHLQTCLYDVSQDISDFYSLPMIWTILNIFVILFTFIYFFTIQLFALNKFQSRALLEIFLSSFILMTLVFNVTNTIKEVSWYN